jgi:hypothetical protein
MMNRDTTIAILVIVAAILGGYTLIRNQDVPLSKPQPGERAVEETIEFVSILDKIHPDEIGVVGAEPAEWPDSCLGLPQFEELCAQVIVEGYRVTLEVDGELLIFRTDRIGSSIRRDTAAE